MTDQELDALMKRVLIDSMKLQRMIRYNLPHLPGIRGR